MARDQTSPSAKESAALHQEWKVIEQRPEDGVGAEVGRNLAVQ